MLYPCICNVVISCWKSGAYGFVICRGGTDMRFVLGFGRKRPDLKQYRIWGLTVMMRVESSSLVFLESGWRVFARQFNLRKGDSLCCRFDGEETLSIRAFDADENRLEPCWESSS